MSLDVFSPYDGAQWAPPPWRVKAMCSPPSSRMRAPPKLSRHRRAGILRAMAALVSGRREELARLATRESGLSLKDTRHEMLRAVDALSLAADATSFDDGAAFAGDIGANGKSRRILSHREPVGLIGAITPFNHPVNQVVAKLAPAIAAAHTDDHQAIRKKRRFPRLPSGALPMKPACLARCCPCCRAGQR